MTTNTLTTLIVDDEAELRKSVVSILQTALPDVEFLIEEAGTGKEALDKVKIKTYDLVLMD
ncbi:MAG: response regulator, partial [Proteobacteria bacterium]